MPYYVIMRISHGGMSCIPFPNEHVFSWGLNRRLKIYVPWIIPLKNQAVTLLPQEFLPKHQNKLRYVAIHYTSIKYFRSRKNNKQMPNIVQLVQYENDTEGDCSHFSKPTCKKKDVELNLEWNYRTIHPHSWRNMKLSNGIPGTPNFRRRLPE